MARAIRKNTGSLPLVCTRARPRLVPSATRSALSSWLVRLPCLSLSLCLARSLCFASLTLGWSDDRHTIKDLLGHRVDRSTRLLGDIVEGQLATWSPDLLHSVALGSIRVSPSICQTLHHLAFWFLSSMFLYNYFSLERRCVSQLC